MVTTRKRKTQGYRDGGAVLADTLIAEDGERAPPGAASHEGPDSPLSHAIAAQRRAEEIQRHGQHQAHQQAAAQQLPEVAQAWLRKHPEYAADPVLNDRLGAVHNFIVLVDGLAPFSDDYFDAVDRKLGLAARPEATVEPPPRRSLPMSAPVSREVPTMSNGQRQPIGREHLTSDEVQIAHASFPHLPHRQAEQEYVANRRVMHQMKRDGAIG